MPPVEQPSPNASRLNAQLNAAHGSLLAIHKALLDHERARYERERGAIRSPGDLLQLVINDPWFAWLRTLSGLITQIDEFISSKDPAAPGEGEALLAQSRKLTSLGSDGGEFQREYQRALQESSEVALAHGQWRLIVNQMDRKS